MLPSTIKFNQGGQNTPIQYGNTQWQHPGNVTVNAIHITMYFENKAYLKSFKERCKAAPQPGGGHSNNSVVHMRDQRNAKKGLFFRITAIRTNRD